MAVRPTIQIGDPRLKAANSPITDFSDPLLAGLITNLRDTMYDVGLIGIAAPQIGENYQVFVTEPRETEARPSSEADQFRVYINPKLVDSSTDEVVIFEACGSVVKTDLFGPVKRPRVVTVEAYDHSGKKFRFTTDGILGRVIQHELDHLAGIEFTEKVLDPRQFLNTEHYLAQVRNLPQHVALQRTALKKFEILE